MFFIFNFKFRAAPNEQPKFPNQLSSRNNLMSQIFRISLDFLRLGMAHFPEYYLQ